MSRLPTVGGDSGTWGTVLNDYLAVSHNSDGTNIDKQNVVTKSANYTLVITDTIVLGNTAGGGFTLTLPLANTMSGKIFRIKNISTNLLTIAASGSDTIDGNASVGLNTRYQTLDVVSDGTNYYIA